ncbi:MAG: 4Fe-4S dicluster domain-containing protein [Bacteroidales bacterium]|nr:4Fe-4S dicluster domain-containing protein [Bacteroidales bacterium]
MLEHILFIVATVVAFGILAWSFSKIFRIIKLLKKPYSVKNIGERLNRVLKVVIGQNKIMRLPIVGFMHALVFWGFLLITFGSGEMVIDGILGFPFDENLANDRIFSFLGVIYNILIAGGDIFAWIIAFLIVVFLIRRNFMKIKRFTGKEMRHRDHKDASFALVLILLLMLSLIGMNAGYIVNAGAQAKGIFPVSSLISNWIPLSSAHSIELIMWWTHILLIFIFANYLPYSKHFHVFMSIPNVYFSRTEPYTKMSTMENVTNEVKLMMDPNAEITPIDDTAEPDRFGLKDVQDGTWKNYIDSLACTQCGRCTSVCPANLTGKSLSPRKVVLDYRRRMEEKMKGLLKEGKTYDDKKSLYPDYTTYEELWACTTCNACAQECPVSIDHPSMILEMRRYIFLEESAAPSLINAMSTNIENNGAPWKYSAADRFNWADNLKITENGEEKEVKVPLMSKKITEGKTPEYLFWVGSAGSYDEGGIEISRNFAKILDYAKVDYACLGTEETDSGDNAKRAGNEFLAQMQAMVNIELMNGYEVKKIVTCDPHDYNTLKNEYSELGGKYEVIHHTQMIQDLIKSGKIKMSSGQLKDKNITFHDPCYLGRGNGEYNAPRFILNQTSNITEMKRNKSRSLCCGAGGTQMFKEAEKGNKEVYELRTEDALETGCNLIATACPMCMTMMKDGVKMLDKEKDVEVMDIAEIVVKNLGI